jgi:hypothetical protein
MLADRLLAVSLHFLGHQNDARRHIDRVDASLDRLVGRPRIFPLDLRISTHYFRARMEGRANGHALTFCSVLGQAACPIAFLAGDLDAAGALRRRAARVHRTPRNTTMAALGGLL